MAASTVATNKICATCRYWTGQRAPKNYNYEVEYSLNGEGMCTGGVWINSRKGSQNYCDDWSQAFGASGSSSSSGPAPSPSGGSSGSSRPVFRSSGRGRRGGISFGKIVMFIIIALIVLSYIGYTRG